jgi:hypothetical protein
MQQLTQLKQLKAQHHFLNRARGYLVSATSSRAGMRAIPADFYLSP